jgi:hypothetical protein
MRLAALRGSSMSNSRHRGRGPGPGEVLIRVHAAAITRDELKWPSDPLRAIPSYEFSGIVAAQTADVDGAAFGDADPGVRIRRDQRITAPSISRPNNADKARSGKTLSR